MELEMHRRDQAVNRGWLPPVSGLGQLSKRPRAPQEYRYLMIACKGQLLRMSPAVLKLGVAGFQGVIRVGQVVFTRFMQIQIWRSC